MRRVLHKLQKRCKCCDAVSVSSRWQSTQYLSCVSTSSECGLERHSEDETGLHGTCRRAPLSLNKAENVGIFVSTDFQHSPAVNSSFVQSFPNLSNNSLLTEITLCKNSIHFFISSFMFSYSCSHKTSGVQFRKQSRM